MPVRVGVLDNPEFKIKSAFNPEGVRQQRNPFRVLRFFDAEARVEATLGWH